MWAALFGVVGLVLLTWAIKSCCDPSTATPDHTLSARSSPKSPKLSSSSSSNATNPLSNTNRNICRRNSSSSSGLSSTFSTSSSSTNSCSQRSRRKNFKIHNAPNTNNVQKLGNLENESEDRYDTEYEPHESNEIERTRNQSSRLSTSVNHRNNGLQMTSHLVSDLRSNDGQNRKRKLDHNQHENPKKKRKVIHYVNDKEVDDRKDKKNRKRKLHQTQHDKDTDKKLENPKKKMKLMHHNKPDITHNGTLTTVTSAVTLNQIQPMDETAIPQPMDDGEEDMNDDVMMAPYIYNANGGYDIYQPLKFKDKASIIQYEMETVSQRLIDKMSDPVDELGKFIQTLSVNNTIHNIDTEEINGDSHLFIKQRLLKIDKQRQIWQKLLFENWYLSKQTKSLVPLIRFLYQILSPPDFNHILPILSGVRILQTVFDGDDGKLYRNMLFESMEQEKRRSYQDKKSKKKKKKRKKRKKEKDIGFMEQMIEKNGLHHFFCVDSTENDKNEIVDDENNKSRQEDEEKKIVDDNDVEMTEKSKKKKRKSSDKQELDEQVEKVQEMKLDSPEQSPKRSIQKSRIKTTLPDLPTAMMEILTITHDFIFRKAPNGQSQLNIDDSPPEFADDTLRISKGLIADADDLHTKQYHSSQLEYHVLLFLHKLLFYSTSYGRQHSKSKVNLIISKIILKRFKIIMKVLKSKHSTLKSKTLCVKIINILFKTHTKQITKILLKRNEWIDRGRMDKSNSNDEEPTLLHHLIESLFCATQFNLYELDMTEKSDVLSTYLNIIFHQQEIIKFVTQILSERNKHHIFFQRINTYSFNFKYESWTIKENIVQSKLHRVKQGFLHILVQFVIFQHQSQTDHEFESLCPQFKNQETAKKYPHLLRAFNQKVSQMIDYVKTNVKRQPNEAQLKYAEHNLRLNRMMNTNSIQRDDRIQPLAQYNNNPLIDSCTQDNHHHVSKKEEMKSNSKEKEQDIVITNDDIDAEMRQYLDSYIENILEEDKFVLLTASPNHTKWGVLQYERAILIASIWRLMWMLIEEMEENDIRISLRCQEFEIMELLKVYMENDDEVARKLFLFLNNKMDIFREKYDDNHNAFQESMHDENDYDENDMNAVDHEMNGVHRDENEYDSQEFD